MRAIFLLSLVISAIEVQGQSMYNLKADTVKISNCGKGELIIENSTKDVSGFLFNAGNGRTIFRRAVVKLNDSTFLLGGDTLKIVSSGKGWQTGGNIGSNSMTDFIGTKDSSDLVFRTNNAERARIVGKSGNVLIGTAIDSGARFQVNGNAVIGDTIDHVQLTVKKPLGQGMSQPIFRVLSPQGGGILEVRGSDDNGYFYIDGYPFPIANNSIYLGKDAGRNAIPDKAVGNVAIGPDALKSVTTGWYNTAIGTENMRALTIGAWNTSIGQMTMPLLTEGSDNCAIGQNSLSKLTTGAANTAIGNNVLQYVTTGSYNVGIGNNSGAVTTGDYNVFIGFQAGRHETGSNKLYIANNETTAPLIYGQFDSSILKMNASIFLGANTSPTASLHIRAASGAPKTAPIKLTTGNLLTTPEGGAIEYDGTDLYMTNSTARYKLIKSLTGQLTTNFGGGSLNAFSAVTATVAIAGVQPGNVVAVSANSGAVNSPALIISAYVTTAGTVTIKAYNASNAAITLASDTYLLKVFP